MIRARPDAAGRLGPFERLWLWYALCVLAVALGWGPGPRPADTAWFAGIHVAVLVLALALPRLVRGANALRVARCALAIVGLPVVFSSLCLVLPALHPEPYEFTWIALDRALTGADPTRVAGSLCGPVAIELLQWCYASFYAIPLVAVVCVGLRRGAASFDRARDLVVFGFLLSYLGYLWWPTLPPYRFLHHETPLDGVWLAGWWNAVIDRAEVHRWNCFPSGHTMLSVVSLVLAWREARAAFVVLLPIVAGLVASTIALRYHYLVDVLAGLVGVPLVFVLGARAMGP